ncbi:hypothetical protein XELAEV_18002190mg [Xenopus laevis]|nr:hypothetical protein XELAEV_18002190mg [Xenopus laevis]
MLYDGVLQGMMGYYGLPWLGVPQVASVTLHVFPVGAQGGSVAAALLADGSYTVRAITRDINKAAAVQLKTAGAQVVCADLDNETSLESALTGAHSAFVVTNFFDHFNKDKEIEQGKRIADMSKRLGLKHVVFSGLENVKKLTGGKLEVLHFDGKGEVEEYFRAIGVPMTSVRLPFYFENLLTFRPTKASDGESYNLGTEFGVHLVHHLHILMYIIMYIQDRHQKSQGPIQHNFLGPLGCAHRKPHLQDHPPHPTGPPPTTQ